MSRLKIIGYIVVDHDGVGLLSAREIGRYETTLWFGDPYLSLFATRKQANACIERTRQNNAKKKRFWPWMDEAIVRPVKAAQ